VTRSAGHNKIRLALIGCGRQMKKNLFPFLRRLPGHEVTACVDPSEPLAKQMQELTGAPLSAPNIEAIDSTLFDAAIIAVPPEPSLHLTEYLVSKDIPCFVEKPAGPSTPALEDMHLKASRGGAHVQVGFNFRFAESVQYLHEVSREPRSQPYTLTVDFYSKYPSTPQWGCDDTTEAWLRHNGVHALDLVQWFAGSQPASVVAHVIPDGEHSFVGVVVLQHENGAISILRMGNKTQKFIIRLSLHCLNGTRYTMPSLERVKLELDQGVPSGGLLFTTRNLDHGWARSGFGPELSHFLERVEAQERGVVTEGGYPSLEDAWKASDLCDRIIESLPARRAVVACG